MSDRGSSVAKRLSCRLPDEVEQAIVKKIGIVIAAGKGAKSRAFRYLLLLGMDNPKYPMPKIPNEGKHCVIEVDDGFHLSFTDGYMRQEEITNLNEACHRAVCVGYAIHNVIITAGIPEGVKLTAKSRETLKRFKTSDGDPLSL